MQDFTRRTLRTWATADAVYAAVLVFLATAIVPWKTPAANVALLAYAGLFAAAAPGLFRGARWGWRLGIVASAVGLVSGVIVVGAVMASWAYLRTVYGDFGRGASVAALLIAATGFQVFGLFPALHLRALLRREVRADLGVGRGVGRGVSGLLVLPVALAAWMPLRYGLDPMAPISDEARVQTMAVLRAAVDGKPRPEAPALVGVPVGASPLYVTLWDAGAVVVRVTGDGPDLAVAVAAAADALPKGKKGRLKVDRVVAVGPVLSESPVVLALSVNPGVDGLRRANGDGTALLPDDLMRAGLFGVAPVVPGIREIRIGLDAGTALKRLGKGGEIERFQTEPFVEAKPGGGRVLSVTRGNTPGPAASPETFAAAAVAGGDFILRQIRPDGRFHYRYLALDDTHPADKDYSIPRHAGTIYALSLVYGQTRQQRFRAGAERAMGWLLSQIPAACGDAPGACLVQGGTAQLGSAALSLVAMLVYQKQTGDLRYAETAARLADFIRFLQRPDGEFNHRYKPATSTVDPAAREMFYSEEAALALVLSHEATGDQRDLDAAERALDYLTGPKYDFFLGRFIFGADHWTCIAADEAWPRLQNPVYLDFCQGYSEFMRRIQYEPGEWAADFDGHYGFSGLLVPQAPAAAGFTEAIVSTYALSRKHGKPDETLRRQSDLALGALSRDQLRLDNAWLARAPKKAAGGIRRSLVEPEIRIDFTQHAVAALIRGAAL